MRLKTLLATLSSSLLVSCANVPDKPDVHICTIDIPRSQLICAPTRQLTKLEQAEGRRLRQYILTNDGVVKLPLLSADKYISMSPDDWQKVSAYMKELRQIVIQQCK